MDAIVPQTKVCNKCGIEKPLASISKSGGGRYCKRCHANWMLAWRNADQSRRKRASVANSARQVKRYSEDPEWRARRVADQKARYQAMDPAKKLAMGRRNHLITKYGIRPEDYDRMLAEQDGRCAICRQIPKKRKKRELHIDHDHETNKVRGLLCGTCNTAIGYFRDSLEIMEAAVEYLKRHK